MKKYKVTFDVSFCSMTSQEQQYFEAKDDDEARKKAHQILSRSSVAPFWCIITGLYLVIQEEVLEVVP